MASQCRSAVFADILEFFMVAIKYDTVVFLFVLQITIENIICIAQQSERGIFPKRIKKINKFFFFFKP